jgi:tetratricopeptide (TPR) repeat protein
MRFISLIFAVLFVSAAWADTTDSFDLRKLRAVQSAQKHEKEAESALKGLLKERPADAALWFQLGLFTCDKARQLKEGRTRKKLMLEARSCFLEASKLGFNDPLLATSLAAVNADGSENSGRISADPQVDKFLKKAEEAYAHHQFEEAIQSYLAALKIEPTNYFGTLNLGDAYFSNGKYADSIEWFRKAIALDPNRETAHRYCGDALLRLGRKDDALDEFISAIIAEPYNGYPWRGLQTGMRAFLLKPRQTAEKVPFADVIEGA